MDKDECTPTGPFMTNFFGIYIHVPFCVRKCSYCDFYSMTDLGALEGFVKVVIEEMDLLTPPEVAFDTIY